MKLTALLCRACRHGKTVRKNQNCDGLPCLDFRGASVAPCVPLSTGDLQLAVRPCPRGAGATFLGLVMGRGPVRDTLANQIYITTAEISTSRAVLNPGSGEVVQSLARPIETVQRSAGEDCPDVGEVGHADCCVVRRKSRQFNYAQRQPIDENHHRILHTALGCPVVSAAPAHAPSDAAE